MGAGVDHAVGGVAVGQVIAAVVPAVEGKLQNLHAGVARVPQQLAHRLSLEAQVLGDDVLPAQLFIDGLEEIQAGAGAPASVPGGFVAVGDGVIGVEAPEMVDAQRVVDGELEGDAAQPPLVAVLLHPLPVKEGVAPQLAVLGKAVGGTAGHLGGDAVPVQLELVRVGPHVGAVAGHVDGKVADDAHALAVGVGLEGAPLPEEQELHRLPEFHLPDQLLLCRGEGGGTAQADILGPGEPGGPAVLVFQGHEQRVAVQPLRAVAKRLIPVRGRGQQPLHRLFQHRVAGLVHQAVVYVFRVVPPVQVPVFLRL